MQTYHLFCPRHAGDVAGYELRRWIHSLLSRDGGASFGLGMASERSDKLFINSWLYLYAD